MRSLALISGSGGSGKTVTALTIAGAWAERGKVVLVDTDPKDAGSATAWLDRATPAPPEALAWTKTDRATLLQHVAGLNAPAIVDTAPGLEAADTIEVAKAVSAVLITGSVYELLEVVQAAKTIQSETGTPIAVAFTRTPSTTDRSALGLATREAVAGVGYTVVGSLRHYAAIAKAKMERGLPFTVTDHRAQADAADLVANLDLWLGGDNGQD